jgi:hypothetical protein
MSVHTAKLIDTDPDTGEEQTFWFASTDATGADLFLPVNQPATDADEAEVAKLFDVQPASKRGATGQDVKGGILYMRIHRNYLREKGAEFPLP